MSKLSTTLAALGLVSTLGLSTLPLASYAAGTSAQVSDAKVTVTVDEAISLSINDKTISLGNITPGTAVAAGKAATLTVTSNTQGQKVNLTLAMQDASSNAMKGTNESNTIPAVTGSEAGNISGSTSAWGWASSADYNTAGSGTVAGTTWKAVPLSGAPASVLPTPGYTTTSEQNNAVNEADKYGFKTSVDVFFAASAGITQAADTYTANVVFTATTQD